MIDHVSADCSGHPARGSSVVTPLSQRRPSCVYDCSYLRSYSRSRNEPSQRRVLAAKPISSAGSIHIGRCRARGTGALRLARALATGLFGGSARGVSSTRAAAPSEAPASANPASANPASTGPTDTSVPAGAVAAVTDLTSRNPATLSAALAAGYPVSADDVAPVGTSSGCSRAPGSSGVTTRPCGLS